MQVGPNYKQVVIRSRKIPISVRASFKVITLVDEPTEWMSQNIIAMEKSGTLRVCIDPKLLNEALKREGY